MAELIFRDAPQHNGDLVFGESASGGAVVVTAVLSATLAAPTCTMAFEAVMDATLSADVDTPATADFAVEIDPNILQPITHDNVLEWESCQPINHVVPTQWQRPDALAAAIDTGWSQATLVPTDSGTGWLDLPAVHASTDSTWEFCNLFTGYGENGWRYPPALQSGNTAAWEYGVFWTAATGDAFTYPPVLQQVWSGHWEDSGFIGISHTDQFAWPPLVRPDWSAVYEYAISPPPGLSVPPVQPPEPEPELPDIGSPDLEFEPPPPEFIPQQVYILMSDIQLIRVPDGPEIDCDNATWSTDRDSWGWRWSATLSNDASLQLLKPDSNGPKEVECTVNGYTFGGIVESYKIERSFGQSQYVVSGRSTSAQLAEPYAPKTSAVVTDALTARQICEAQLINTGWVIDWQIVDWVIPANVCSWQTRDPIGVIRQIIGAVGALVQTDPHQKVLRIMSRYPVSPHKWQSTDTAATLPGDLIKSLGSEYSRKPRYNRAIVAGVSDGVLVTGTLDGTAGDILAPQVIDNLITHVDAGQERARIEIAKGGQREDIRTATWLTRKGEAGPGLLLPGQLLAVDDPADPFRAQIDGTQINAVSTEEKLTVTQTLHLERWHG